MESYDLTVIGRGLSSLLYLKKFYDSKNNHNKKVLIIESSKQIPEKFISAWQGPGIIDLEKEFGLSYLQSWNDIFVGDSDLKIDRNIYPFFYATFEYKKIINDLLNFLSSRDITLKYEKVLSLTENENKVVIDAKNTYFSDYVVNSAIDLSGTSLDNEMMQIFTGTKIRTSLKHGRESATIMEFKKNEQDILFFYELPLDEHEILVETTTFSSKKTIEDLKKIHQDRLEQYGEFEVLSKEKGKIPMTTKIKSSRSRRVINIGTIGGFVIASSGYSLLRSAKWAAKNGSLPFEKIEIKTNGINQWLDKIFLKAIKSFPSKSPEIFLSLFSAKNLKPLIRFLADHDKYFDRFNVISNSPKKIMINAIFK